MNKTGNGESENEEYSVAREDTGLAEMPLSNVAASRETLQNVN